MQSQFIYSNQLENPWPEHEPNEYPHNDEMQNGTNQDPPQSVDIEHFDGC